MRTLTNQSLQSYNTFGVDVRAKQLCFLEDYDDVKEFAKYGHRPILGKGSNVLLTHDVDIVGINAFMNPPELVNANDRSNPVLVKVGSGYLRDEFVKRSLEAGYNGLENMGLIPGTVGAGTLGNIGAYGKEIEEFIYSVEYIDLKTHELHTLLSDQCDFSYRRSVFKTMSDYFISSVVFRFDTSPEYAIKADYPDIQKAITTLGSDNLKPIDIYKLVCEIRTAKMPSRDEFGTAGSFFKNPIVSAAALGELQKKDPAIKFFPHGDRFKLSAGYLLEQLGYKGKMIGKVGSYRNQSLVLVNQGGSGQEIDAFARMIEDDVLQMYG
ncbi:MAG: UDP-N-acetylmuramate dehydrogenase, partial [Candidatus Absconditabacterales bacterium]